MINKTLALSVRALRVDARSKMSHLLRFGLAIIVMMSLISIQESNTNSAPGLSLFSWIVYTNAVLISIMVPLYFANAITEEKEERTLALLLIADVNPATIVLGKALPRLFTLLFVLIVQFPFTMLAITLGGVSFTQIAAAYLALMAYALFVACLALFCSVMMRLSANAVGAAGLLLLGYHILPGIIYGVSGVLKDKRIFPSLGDAGLVVSEKIWDTMCFSRLEVLCKAHSMIRC